MPRAVIPAKRRGLTLIELMVVVAIIAILVGLLLPAVQKVREAANRIACSNNLKQLGLGMHHYHDANGEFPPAFVNNGPYGTSGFAFTHGWAPFLLPYIEQQALHDLYRWDFPLYAPENRPVASSHLKVFQCPSTPERDRYMTVGPFQHFGTRGACGDYTIALGVDAGLVPLGLADPAGDYRGALTHTPTPALGPTRGATPTRLADVTDGASNTVLLAEDAGRPRLWLARRGGPEQALEGGPWNHYKGGILLQGKAADGTAALGPCPVNCTNNGEVYAFHPGGAYAAFADGSVHFLREGMTVRVLARLITRAGGEVVAAGGY